MLISSICVKFVGLVFGISPQSVSTVDTFPDENLISAVMLVSKRNGTITQIVKLIFVIIFLCIRTQKPDEQEITDGLNARGRSDEKHQQFRCIVSQLLFVGWQHPWALKPDIGSWQSGDTAKGILQLRCIGLQEELLLPRVCFSGFLEMINFCLAFWNEQCINFLTSSSSVQSSVVLSLDDQISRKEPRNTAKARECTSVGDSPTSRIGCFSSSKRSQRGLEIGGGTLAGFVGVGL